MNLLKRSIYNFFFVFPIWVYRKLFLTVHVWGRENIPKGPKIYVVNHITSTDPYWLHFAFTEPVHSVIGPGYKLPIVAWLLDAFEQINAMPAHRKTVVDKAVAYLKRGDAVYIAPEGDIQEPFELGRFHDGIARIYRKAHVPIVPIALVAPKRAMREHAVSIEVEGRIYRTVTVLRGPFLINVGTPITPDIPDGTDQEKDEHLTDLVKERIEFLMNDIRSSKFWL